MLVIEKGIGYKHYVSKVTILSASGRQRTGNYGPVPQWDKPQAMWKLREGCLYRF